MKISTITKTLTAPVVAILLGQGVYAQSTTATEPDKIGLSLATSSTTSGKARLKDGNSQASFDGVRIDNSTITLAQEMGLGEAGSITLNLTYNRTAIDEGDRRHQADRLPLPNELQALGASLAYSTRVAENWALSSSVGASSHVTKHQLLSKGWGVNGHVLGLYTYSPKLTLAVGLAYDSLSEDLKCVPMLGFDWKPADKWSVAIGIPRTAVSYELRPNLTLALAASGDGGTYYIKEDPRSATTGRSLADSKLEYTEVRLGLQADWRINHSISLSGSLGQVVYREFKYIDRDCKLKSRDAVPFLTLAITTSF